MSLASSHDATSPMGVDGSPDDISSGEILPPPLAEIAAHSTKVASAKKRRSVRAREAKSRTGEGVGSRKASGSTKSTAASGEMVVGVFVGLTAEGEPQVNHPL